MYSHIKFCDIIILLTFPKVIILANSYMALNTFQESFYMLYIR